MKIVVIGGTGLIGSKTVAILRQRGHEVVAANTGVNTITGEGLKEALTGAVGGRIDYSRNLASNEAYDPATKSWEQRAPRRAFQLVMRAGRGEDAEDGVGHASGLLIEHDLRANAFRVCREEKPVSTFSDHALSRGLTRI